MQANEIIVVTGLARSGTTCMMRMLEAGGIPLYYDKDKPLEWRENGVDYLNYNIILRETDKINDLKAGDASWLEECKGMAVKILAPTKVKIPTVYSYRFIYMDRKLKHMVNSQRKYLMRAKNRKMPDHDRAVIEHIRELTREGIKLLGNYPGSHLIMVKFEDMLKHPRAVAMKVASFLGERLDIEKMAKVVWTRPAYCLNRMVEEEIYKE